MSNPNPKNLPWFPFFTAAWLGSNKVDAMTMTERGIYITLLAMNWQYGSVVWDAKTLSSRLKLDKRTVANFLEKHQDLVELSGTYPLSSMEATFPKLLDFALKLGKSGRGVPIDEMREMRGERVYSAPGGAGEKNPKNPVAGKPKDKPKSRPEGRPQKPGMVDLSAYADGFKRGLKFEEIPFSFYHCDDQDSAARLFFGAELCEYLAGHNGGFPDCPRCQGRGNYWATKGVPKVGESPVTCSCAVEPYRSGFQGVYPVKS